MAILLSLPKSDKIIGLWHLEGNLLDSSPTGNNGTGSNISYTNGKIYQCASFNGTNSEVTTTTQYTLPTTYSISCVIKTTTVDRYFISFINPQTGDPSKISNSMGIDSNGKLYFYYWDGSQRYISSSASVNTGNFVVVGMTLESGNLKLYVSGSNDGSASSVNPNSFNGWWRLGRRGTEWYNGLLDEVIWWNVKLTDDEMKQAYNAMNYIYAKNVAIGSPMIF